MRYIGRLLFYIIIFGLTFSVGCVVVFRFVPVTVTPFKIVKLLEHGPEHGWRIRSNWEPLARISTQMQKAVVATEDNNFLTHHGFDFKEIEKAIEENKSGRRLRGASTISQHTAKNAFCTPSSTWFRKGVETYYTVLIELIWDKRRIMEVYLNLIETHPNIYGAEATARVFYNKTASELNNYEAAMTATVLPNPARRDIGHPSSYMTRRAAQVRNLMTKVGELDYDDPPEKDQGKPGAGARK